jgi:hypothetical protein
MKQAQRRIVIVQRSPTAFSSAHCSSYTVSSAAQYWIYERSIGA